MNESVGTTVCQNDEGTTRGRLCRPRCDWVPDSDLSGMPLEATPPNHPSPIRLPPGTPVPPLPPDDFVVRVGEGFSGSLHELADAMEAFGPGAAAGVLLSAIGLVERECEWIEGARERLGLLRGAVMAAGTGVRMAGMQWLLEGGHWERWLWVDFGR